MFINKIKKTELSLWHFLYLGKMYNAIEFGNADENKKIGSYSNLYNTEDLSAYNKTEDEDDHQGSRYTNFVSESSTDGPQRYDTDFGTDKFDFQTNSDSESKEKQEKQWQKDFYFCSNSELREDFYTNISKVGTQFEECASRKFLYTLYL